MKNRENRENREAIESLERIYGVRLDADEDLRRLAGQLGLPEAVLVLGIQDLRRIWEAVDQAD